MFVQSIMDEVMKKRHKLKFLTCLACSVFVSVVLLSQVGTVQAGRNVETAPGDLQSNVQGEAQRISDEGAKLYQQGTVESLRQAIEKWGKALKLYQQIGDKKWQATVLNSIGLVYDSLGEKQQALKLFNQALPLWIEVGNKAGQATTLTSIGAVYFSTGDNPLS